MIVITQCPIIYKNVIICKIYPSLIKITLNITLFKMFKDYYYISNKSNTYILITQKIVLISNYHLDI